MKKIVLSLICIISAAIGTYAEEPTYIAYGNNTNEYYYAAYDYTYAANPLTPSIDNLKIEVYGDGDSIVVRKWYGVEGYDLAITIDSEGNIANILPIVNGTPNPYVSSGYSYVDTGLEVPSPWIAGVYNSYSFYTTEGDTADIVLGTYAYTTTDYSASEWGYIDIRWAIPESPEYVAVGNNTNEYYYAAYNYTYTANPLTPSLTDMRVESYGDSIVVRSWWGVDGYDLAVTLDSVGSITNILPIVYGTPNPYVSSGYSYVDTGLEVPSPWITGVYNSYSFYTTEGDTADIVLGAYAYTATDYSASEWGYIDIRWAMPNTNGITSVKANAVLKDTPAYNLAGQRVSDSAKGLIIKNGKKYIRR